MTDNAYIYIISPLITAVIAGVGYLVKHYIDMLERKREREIAERDKRRQEIEDRITQTELRQSRTEKQMKKIITVVMSCEHTDCPTKEKVMDVFSGEEL